MGWVLRPCGVRGRLGPAEQDFELQVRNRDVGARTGTEEGAQSQGRGFRECLLRRKREHLRARMCSLKAPWNECSERSLRSVMGGVGGKATGVRRP